MLLRVWSEFRHFVIKGNANIILHLIKLMISVFRTHGVDFLLVLLVYQSAIEMPKSYRPVTKGDSSGE